MIQTSCIISKVQHIRHAIGTYTGFIQKLLDKQVNLIVYTRTGLELAEFSVASELMTERLLTALENKVAEINNLVVERFPNNIANTISKRIIVIYISSPTG